MRILIDCSFANFSRALTGIPRVTLQYIEQGYRWAEKTGIDVIPVVPVPEGLFVQRPLPGRDVPQSLRDRIRPTLSDRVLEILRVACHLANHYSKDVLHHALMLIASVIRVPGGRRVAERLSRAYARFAVWPEQEIERRLNRRAAIEPESGDVLFCTAYWHDVPPELYHRLKERGVIIVPLVHDLLPITHAEYYQAPWCDRFRDNFAEATKYANAFFCVSAYSRDALANFIFDQRLLAPPLAIVYNGCERLSEAESDSEQSQAEEFAAFCAVLEEEPAPLIMVGSIEPKKGHVAVLEVLEQKWHDGYARALVIIGNPGWMYEAIAQRIRRSRWFGKRLFWFTGLDDAALAVSYRACHAMIFASLAEGFGLPMIEAASYCKPVIVLKTEIATEILGPFGIYFQDAHALGEAIDGLEDPERYRAALQQLETFRWPSWEETVPRVLDMLSKLPQGEAVPPQLVYRG